MSDVRLTATNPEDSSVVPVACNSKGELLIEDVVIEEIPNDVVLDGVLTVNKGLGGYTPTGSNYLVCADDDGPIGTLYWARDKEGIHLNAGGMAGPDGKWLPFDFEKMQGAAQIALSADSGTISFGTQGYKTPGEDLTVTTRFIINDYGPSSYQYTLEPDPTRSDHRKIEVREELEFLRSQLRELMEKLKMTPTGGWEVWDGSAET